MNSEHFLERPQFGLKGQNSGDGVGGSRHGGETGYVMQNTVQGASTALWSGVTRQHVTVLGDHPDETRRPCYP